MRTGQSTLNLSELGSRRLRTLPRTSPREAGIVHLGLGNFHRAHQAVYTARALDLEDGPWGIVGVTRQNRAVIDAMEAQDNAYTVLTLGAETHIDVVRVHQDLLLAAADPSLVVQRIADRRTRIVTITVTEAGYTFSTGTGRLDLAHAELQRSLRGGPSLTTIGQLVGGLRLRHRSSGAPLTVISCDNLVRNGELTRSLIEELISLSVPPVEAEELVSWMSHSVTFPSSMVDRIVPRTTEAHRGLALQSTGLADACPVAAEPFSMWVIEDDFATPRPRWDDVGAIISADVHAYELLKIRLLNGTHSLLAYLGMLSGAYTIDEAVAHDEIRAAADAFMHEMSWTLRAPPGLDISEYQESLHQRFSNRAMAHRTSQVASEGSLKVPTRISDPVRERARAQLGSPMSALLAAVFIRVATDPAATETSARAGLRDPAQSLLIELGREHPDPDDRAKAVLLESGLFPEELGNEMAFISDAVRLHAVCCSRGVGAVIQDALSEARSNPARHAP